MCCLRVCVYLCAYFKYIKMHVCVCMCVRVRVCMRVYSSVFVCLRARARSSRRVVFCDCVCTDETLGVFVCLLDIKVRITCIHVNMYIMYIFLLPSVSGFLIFNSGALRNLRHECFNGTHIGVFFC